MSVQTTHLAGGMKRERARERERERERERTCFKYYYFGYYYFGLLRRLAKMCLRVRCMALPTPSFAFTLGYGITLKIAKLFAFGCLMHKDGCYVTPVVS